MLHAFRAFVAASLAYLVWMHRPDDEEHEFAREELVERIPLELVWESYQLRAMDANADLSPLFALSEIEAKLAVCVLTARCVELLHEDPTSAEEWEHAVMGLQMDQITNEFEGEQT